MPRLACVWVGYPCLTSSSQANTCKHLIELLVEAAVLHASTHPSCCFPSRHCTQLLPPGFILTCTLHTAFAMHGSTIPLSSSAFTHTTHASNASRGSP